MLRVCTLVLASLVTVLCANRLAGPVQLAQLVIIVLPHGQ